MFDVCHAPFSVLQGRFDVFGHSHQIFHVLTAVSTAPQRQYSNQWLTCLPYVRRCPQSASLFKYWALEEDMRLMLQHNLQSVLSPASVLYGTIACAAVVTIAAVYYTNKFVALFGRAPQVLLTKQE